MSFDLESMMAGRDAMKASQLFRAKQIGVKRTEESEELGDNSCEKKLHSPSGQDWSKFEAVFARGEPN